MVLFGRKPSNHAPRTGEALHKPLCDGVGDGHEHDRNGARCLERDGQIGRAVGHQNFGLAINEVLRVREPSCGVIGLPAVVNLNVAISRAPIEWSGSDVSLGSVLAPARARAAELARIAKPGARA